MKIVIVGLSHKTAPVALREKVAMAGESLEQQLLSLVSLQAISEGLVLSTCNRLEVYCACHDTREAAAAVKQWLCQTHQIESAELLPHLYTYHEEEAVEQGLRVAASLDSLVVGEAQILGQMKQAFQEASKVGATGTILNKLFHRLFQVAKKIRTQTGIAKNPVSIASVAVNLARHIFGQLSGHTCLLIGAGEMCELAAQHLVSQGVKILVVNRTLKNAQTLAAQFNGEGFSLDALKKQLTRADIILSSTGAAQLMIEADAVRQSLKDRRQKPQFYIDIAVPRDLDPAISEIENAYLYDIDDLKQIVEDNKEDRGREVRAAEEIIQMEIAPFVQWKKSLAVTPTVVALREKMEHMRDQELENFHKSWPSLSSQERDKVDRFARLLVNKILHHPLKQLRTIAAEEDSGLYVDAARKLFELDRKL
ncbi:MAG: glutamyl-tRNA reductase [Magnetococcales bacterium]|nr:glutamyl-tRNA reductase [Magnetococcales bacterium]